MLILPDLCEVSCRFLTQRRIIISFSRISWPLQKERKKKKQDRNFVTTFFLQNSSLTLALHPLISLLFSFSNLKFKPCVSGKTWIFYISALLFCVPSDSYTLELCNKAWTDSCHHCTFILTQCSPQREHHSNTHTQTCTYTWCCSAPLVLMLHIPLLCPTIMPQCIPFV